MVAVSPSSFDNHRWGDPSVVSVSVPMQTPGGSAPDRARGERAICVLVEPLYLGVAAALALDAGWGSVELAARGADPLIPLVSFEQRPTQRGGRCRVRGDVSDLRAAFMDDVPTVIGSLVNVRPLAAQLARSSVDRIDFVPVVSAGQVSADAWAVCGVLIRTLLDESEEMCVLDDAAGIAVSLAGGADDALASALAAGARWRRHRELGGSDDDMRVAVAMDSVGAVPRIVECTNEGLVVTEW